MQNQIHVPLTGAFSKDTPVENISALLDQVAKTDLDNAPWANFPYKPACAFAMAYSINAIYLKFYVAEETVLARFTQPNDLVYQDSCVEFFIAFNGEAGYYNLEFNCLGTAYVGYGTGKTDREPAPVEIVRLVKSNSYLYSADGTIKWELTLMIPVAVFYKHSQPELLSGRAKGNFYKCGDDLPAPHYLTWNPMTSESPNFHLPEFFGDLVFDG